MKRTSKPLSELTDWIKKFPQVLRNLPVRRRVNFEEVPRIRKVIDNCRNVWENQDEFLYAIPGLSRYAASWWGKTRNWFNVSWMNCQTLLSGTYEMTKSTLDIAREALEIEIEGIRSVISKLNEDFESVVDLLYSLRGRIIVTGVGKSGIIRRRIAATFTSTVHLRSLFIQWKVCTEMLVLWAVMTL